ncbi:hypothetical protein BSY16_51 [Sinorhizobium sp. RAC02]|nr:hypothetical protein BSY16_51 [Sinorhizobium sp. RAC02]
MDRTIGRNSQKGHVLWFAALVRGHNHARRSCTPRRRTGRNGAGGHFEWRTQLAAEVALFYGNVSSRNEGRRRACRQVDYHNRKATRRHSISPSESMLQIRGLTARHSRTSRLHLSTITCLIHCKIKFYIREGPSVNGWQSHRKFSFLYRKISSQSLCTPLAQLYCISFAKMSENLFAADSLRSEM